MDIKPEEKVARLFDSLAPDYDTSGVPFFQPIARGLIDVVAPQPGERLLDVGCGRGAVLLPAARAVHPGLAVGIDISPVMVETCRRLVAEAGLENVTVEVGNAMAPGFPDGTFDVVTSSLVLFFLPDPLTALQSWWGQLRPGGRVGVTTFGPASAAWQYVDEVLAPYLPQVDARSSGARGPFASDQGMEQLLDSAGFVDVRTVVQELDVRFASADQWYAFSMTLGQRAAWLAMDDDQRGVARAETTRRFEEQASPDGSLVLSQVIRHSLGVRPDA